MQGAVASRVARAKDRSSSIAESNVSIELHSIIFSISLNRSRFIVHLPFFSHNPCNLPHIQDDPVLPNSDKTKTSARYTVLSIVYQVYKAYRCLAALWGAVLGLPFVYSPPEDTRPFLRCFPRNNRHSRINHIQRNQVIPKSPGFRSFLRRL